VRGIKSAENLIARVQGDIDEVDGVLKITQIRLQFEVKIPAGTQEKVERVLESFAEKCPAYQSVKGCIDCTWNVNVTEE